jgi:hypothetical protein
VNTSLHPLTTYKNLSELLNASIWHHGGPSSKHRTAYRDPWDRHGNHTRSTDTIHRVSVQILSDSALSLVVSVDSARQSVIGFGGCGQVDQPPTEIHPRMPAPSK